jgi:hypothetical protein
MNNTALSVIKSVDDIERVAGSMAKSGYFQDSREMAQAVVKIMAGQEMGFGPFASMIGVHIIQGKPGFSANLMAAAVKSSGRYDYRINEISDAACEITFFEGGKEAGRSRFTKEDATKAGTQNMGKFPRNMLFARAMSNGVRWYCPDVFSGAVAYTPEELGATVNENGDVISGTFVEPARTPAPVPTLKPLTAPVAPDWKPADEIEPIEAVIVEKPAPITQSHNGSEYASMDIPALAGRHAHYIKEAKSKAEGATDETRAQAKATADYIESLIKAKRESK